MGGARRRVRGERGVKKFREGDVQITRRLWSLTNYMNAKYFHAGITDLETKDDRPRRPTERLLASPEVSRENKQRAKATAEECNFVKNFGESQSNAR